MLSVVCVKRYSVVFSRYCLYPSCCSIFSNRYSNAIRHIKVNRTDQNKLYLAEGSYFENVEVGSLILCSLIKIWADNSWSIRCVWADNSWSIRCVWADNSWSIRCVLADNSWSIRYVGELMTVGQSGVYGLITLGQSGVYGLIILIYPVCVG